MASIIKLKRSLVAASVPSSLQEGEIAVNLEDKKLFVGGKTGGSNTQVLSGDLYNLTTTNGSDSAIITLTVDNTTLSNDAITIAAGEGIDVSASGSTITLAGEDASTSNKGVASFNSTNFSTSSGAVSIASSGVDTAQLAPSAVETAKINNSAVTSAKILDKTIVAGDIADGTITATQIGSGALTANTIGNNSVALGTKTTGNYVATVAAGTDMVVSGSGSETAGVTVTLKGAITANTTGFATKLETARTIGMTGDVVWTSPTFDGTGNVTATATIQPNAVTMGTDTSGNYVATVSGTANEITVSGSGSETAGVTVSLPDNVTVGNNLTVSGNTSVSGHVTVDGNLTVEGAVTYISSSTVNVDDSAIKLSANNAADTVDIGMYGMYVNSGTKYSGWFRDASDSGIIKFYKETGTEPTTTVNTSASGYALAQVDAVIDGGSY